MKQSSFAVLVITCATALPTAAFSENKDDVTELAPVVVTSDPFAGRSALEALHPTQVLSGDDLERARAQTLGESVQNLPGVQSADFGAGASRPVIRGQGGPRVRILDGGVGVIDASTISPDHNAAVEPFRAQQIEVLKGPASLLYGSGAIGGVVNVVSDLIAQEPINGIGGSIGSAYTSVNNGKSLFGHAEGGNGQFAFHIDGLKRDTDDYDIPGFAESAELRAEESAEAAPGEEPDEVSGFVPNTSTDTKSVAGGVSWTGENGFLGAGVTQYQSYYGIPGHAHHEEEEGGEEAEEESVFIDLDQTRYEIRGGYQSSGGFIERTRFSAISTEYTHSEIEFEGAQGEVGTVFSNDGTEARVELTHKLLRGWRGVFGVQGFEQQFKAIGDEAFVQPVDSRTASLFLVEEKSFAGGRFSAGGRIEKAKHDAQAQPDRDYNLYSVSLGWHQPLGGDNHLRFGVSRSERAPDVLELYANGEHLATRTIETGNVNLNKERALNLDFGFHGSSGKWFTEFDLFSTAYSDYIFAENVDLGGAAQAEADAEGLTPVAYTQADARFFGGELEIGYQLNDDHTVSLVADTVQAELNNGDDLPRIPADRAGLHFDGSRGAWTYATKLVRVFSQTGASEQEGNTAGYTLLGADLAYNWVIGASNLEIAVRGRNLLDEEARNHISFLKELAPLPGRSIQVDFEWSF